MAVVLGLGAYLVIGLVLVLALIVLLRFLLPVVGDVAHRAYHNGPAPAASPGGTGTWLGWVVSLLWSLSEGKREELYEYMRHNGVQRSHDEVEPEPVAEPDLPPRVVHQLAAPAAPVGVAHAEPLLSPDARWWWDGRHWQDTEVFAPMGARRNGEGSRWWDGARWRVVPQRGPVGMVSLPRPVSAPPPEPQASWLESGSVSFSPPPPVAAPAGQ